ncbi:MAG TPA: addiction module protein [Chthoniobacterales bacterium]
MIARQEIRQMPFEEKLALLEAVWTEISAEPEKIEVPRWHKEILDERDQALRSGKESIWTGSEAET